MRGENEPAAKLLARSVQQMHVLGNQIEEAAASGFLGRAYGQLGQLPQALEAANQGIRLAEEIEHLPTLGACLLYRGMVKSWCGDWDGALRDFRKGLDLAEQIGDLFREYTLRGGRGGWCYLLAGDYVRATEDLTQAVRLAERLGTRFVLGLFTSYLAEARLYGGGVVEGLRLSREALQIAKEGRQPWDQSVAFRALAQALSMSDPPDYEGAEEAIRNALTIQEALRMKWELAHSLVVYGQTLRAKGDPEKAKEALARSIDMFKEMGLGWGVARAEQVLLEL